VILFSLFTRSGDAAQIQVLNRQLHVAVSRLPSVQRLSASNRLDLAIALPLRNREALTKLLRQIYDPASPNYRRSEIVSVAKEQNEPDRWRKHLRLSCAS
jgi:hypothetical protein